jgi:hypothetical protein
MRNILLGWGEFEASMQQALMFSILAEARPRCPEGVRGAYHRGAGRSLLAEGLGFYAMVRRSGCGRDFDLDRVVRA